ncbi:MAG: glutamate--tRNA ligase [Betaproteobacteria bacterium TMED41]|nr:MAG: glutamate--tRNA ligase [Betaproteobacteria bacterium TMED41]
MNIRTRFAPSPTGYLHLGGARTALFSWAFAKKMGGEFILRIEDTDELRSSQQSVEVILDSLSWLGLDYDVGPLYQSKRTERYKTIIQNLLANGQAYFCYCSNDELDDMREFQKSRGEKPRYNGLWRPENVLEKNMVVPKNISPVIRFRNPDQGEVSWNDQVKGKITIKNTELDDLIIARADGTPTYNFSVVVDDSDMKITHVIRGDDHINNTPRQINIFKALKERVPDYAHLPMIHGPDGEKLSKRHGAISVLKYKQEGYLAQALLNYLARLGWGHGNCELFSTLEFIDWFSLGDCSKSPARFDFEKLKWVNSNYLKKIPHDELCSEVSKRFSERDVQTKDGPSLTLVCELMNDRVQTLEDLTNACEMFFLPTEKIMNFSEILKIEQFTKSSELDKKVLFEAFNDFVASYPVKQDEVIINDYIKTLLIKFALKMPQFAIPLRLILLGKSQTPAIAKVLSVLGKKIVCKRILKSLET